ncbi:plasma membrane urea transmembrane transporter [Schizosaccharomyces pombe]|uniref:Probable urea active transporter 2 n=1 Tax=Schizosaccharomyces pombe (strain 972 / ATCC 24843) TaxID=284812 RepID=DUR32_SCHPO|nr:putative urea transporter [Schizosaccharomyces pombe]Q8TFG0.1 RecName: Full=Probable urea active transporter 2 [Schizosaccharomyces pombe 972h-]CAD27908.1 urea transporter (predicted) [Schizosaccharomyces pombe]|eukprot:NP_001018763.1 putative urea transporter [Schizosaccharomyces pombe]
MEPILNQGYGYGFALGLGAAFALLMAIITKVLTACMGQTQNSERFSTASRSVKSGLISSSTVSAWTWPATLLSSGAWSYTYGIMGGFMYGVGGTIQITLFLFLAIQIKKKAPAAHTVSECFFIRFGKLGHCVYLFYCISTNVLVSSLLLLGGSQGFSSTTGMNTVAACFLLPLGVMVYTTLGGLKATFISDWIHTVMIYIILIVTCYTVYCSSSLIGSPAKMYDMLKEVQEVYPATGGQSYLSFKNSEMMYLTWSVMIGGLSSVFGDPGYSQRAIASDAKSVFQGYLMGGLCWWIIPMALGSSAGLACRALLLNPASVTYPNVLSSVEISSGLPVIYGMASIFGKSGAAAGLVMLFMSITSATSAELIAFSSVTTYDIFRAYINPAANGKQLVRTAHLSVIGFSLFIGALSVGFNYAGVTAGWLLTFLGIILTPEVSAVTLCLFWNKMTRFSLVVGAPFGTITGVVCWLASTYSFCDGIVNKDTVMTSKACFVGNIVSMASSPLYIVLLSYIWPDKETFDLNQFRNITVGDDIDTTELNAIVSQLKDERILKLQTYWSIGINLFILIGCYVIIPTALLGSNHDLSKSSFSGLIIVCLIWILVAAIYIILFPLWQGRKSLANVISHIIRLKAPENILLDGLTPKQSSEDVGDATSFHMDKLDKEKEKSSELKTA